MELDEMECRKLGGNRVCSLFFGWIRRVGYWLGTLREPSISTRLTGSQRTSTYEYTVYVVRTSEQKRKSSIIPINPSTAEDRSIDRRPHRDTIIITTISRQQTADSNNNNNIAVIIVTKVRAHGGFETETMDHHDKAVL